MKTMIESETYEEVPKPTWDEIKKELYARNPDLNHSVIDALMIWPGGNHMPTGQWVTKNLYVQEIPICNKVVWWRRLWKKMISSFVIVD